MGYGRKISYQRINNFSTDKRYYEIGSHRMVSKNGKNIGRYYNYAPVGPELDRYGYIGYTCQD